MEEQEKEYYLKQGFSESQVEELEAGKKAGLDISVYENTALTSMQMYQLRLGLSDGLDMRPYADGRFDWFQIEEIRKGLSDGLDVRLYADPKIPSEKMEQMRKGLGSGMDLSDFLTYHHSIMREVRHALEQKIDITTYVTKGYDAGQLREIRNALADGLDIHQYLSPEFRAVSIGEIAEGLREGVEVELYAKPCYTWTQMREIRLGLRNQVDISYYSSPLYDRYQMEQIRKGLEDGLEVSEYTSLMYPAFMMEQIRTELLTTGVRHNEYELSAEEVNKENKDGIFIKISGDKMTALIRFDKEKFGVTTRKDILRSLRLLGITQNIDPRMMDDLLAGKHLNELVPIAKGRPPVNGADAYYEFFFDTNKKRTPKMNEDGSVNFQEVDWYEQVKKDQKLAYYHSAGKGEAGATVTGVRIPPKRGKELQNLRGKGIRILPDKKTYVADCDGRVDLKGFTLEVSQVLHVREVTLSTGNLHFEGNIVVDGDVGPGVTIEAGGDVIISGFVENAHIEAGGDVVLKKGVNAKGQGLINAQGNVEGQFFESVNVRAGGNINVNYCLHSNVYSDDTVTVHGGKGVIIGGNLFAAREIRTFHLGNVSGIKSRITLGISDAMRKESREIEERLAELDGEIRVLVKGKSDFEKKYPPEVRNIMEVYIKIENAIYTVVKQREETVERQKKLSAQIAKTIDAQLVVNGNVYDGNLIDINGRKLITVEAHNVTIKNMENRIAMIQN